MENAAQNCRAGKCENGKCGTKMQDVKMHCRKGKYDIKNLGLENAGQVSMESEQTLCVK